MIAVLFTLLLAFFLVSRRILERAWAKHTHMTLTFGESAVYQGRNATLREVVENRSRLPIPILEAGFRIEKGLRFVNAENTQISDYLYKRDIFSLLGRERITRTYELETLERGHYHITQVSYAAGSYLPTFRGSVNLPDADDFFVYAARTDIRDLMPTLTGILGERESDRKVYEDPYAFAGIRDYTIQDPMKSINWKASAKGLGLMVNTYTSVKSEQVEIYLDVSDPFIVKSKRLVEESISIAATMAEFLLVKGQAVGIHVNAGSENGFVLPPGRGREQLKTIEQFLTTDFTNAPTNAFADLLATENMNGRGAKDANGSAADAIPVLISKNADADQKAAILARLPRDRKALWVIPAWSDTEPEISSEPNLILMKRRVN